jgi:CPA1 family monovalent cation:H+ antiporter
MSSLVVVLIEELVPGVQLRPAVENFVGRIDFDQTLMHGLLSFLLFAGALHVDLEGLINQRWTIAALATVGVLVSVVVVGGLTWLAFGLLGVRLPLFVCLTFGALISPTDPIAIMGLLKEMRAPQALEAQIAGESLFNDGIGVVVFLALASMADLSGAAGAHAPVVNPDALVIFALREVIGGIGLGLAFGYCGYRALKSIDDHPLELLITLALAMFLYSVSFWIHVSGPIAVVVAGLLVGNPGRRFAMSARTREHVDAFWRMIDEILNAILFLLLGLEVFAVKDWAGVLMPAIITIPICLLARWIAVAIPVLAMSVRGSLRRGLVPILTWSGLRGGSRSPWRLRCRDSRARTCSWQAPMPSWCSPSWCRDRPSAECSRTMGWETSEPRAGRVRIPPDDLSSPTTTSSGRRGWRQPSASTTAQGSIRRKYDHRRPPCE